MIRARSAALALAGAVPILALGAPPAAAQETPPPAPSETPAPKERPPAARGRGSSTYLFQVTMVLAQKGGSRGFKEIPLNAQKALQDLEGQVPYRSYEMLDSVLLRTNRVGQAKMNGPEGRPFQLEIIFDPGQPGEPDIQVRNFEVWDETVSPKMRVEVGGPEGLKHGEEKPASGPRRVISTTFGMWSGETLVVGSSRLDGGEKALILLVTALPPPGSGGGC
jgi:hypothetical protein